eukprot:364407-Chlamydomonas_euryale.AAC.5
MKSRGRARYEQRWVGHGLEGAQLPDSDRGWGTREPWLKVRMWCVLSQHCRRKQTTALLRGSHKCCEPAARSAHTRSLFEGLLRQLLRVQAWIRHHRLACALHAGVLMAGNSALGLLHRAQDAHGLTQQSLRSLQVVDGLGDLQERVRKRERGAARCVPRKIPELRRPARAPRHSQKEGVDAAAFEMPQHTLHVEQGEGYPKYLPRQKCVPVLSWGPRRVHPVLRF